MEILNFVQLTMLWFQFVILLITASVTFIRVGSKLGRLTKSLILFNLILCLIDALFSIGFLLNLSMDDSTWINITYYKNLAVPYLCNINWIYLLRLKRVQVQLRTPNKETN